MAAENAKCHQVRKSVVGSFAFQKPGFFGEAGLLFFKASHYPQILDLAVTQRFPLSGWYEWAEYVSLPKGFDANRTQNGQSHLGNRG